MRRQVLSNENHSCSIKNIPHTISRTNLFNETPQGPSLAEQIQVPRGECLLPNHQDCPEERVLVQGE